MRVGLWTAGIVLTSAFAALAATVNMTPPATLPALPAATVPAKATTPAKAPQPAPAVVKPAQPAVAKVQTQQAREPTSAKVQTKVEAKVQPAAQVKIQAKVTCPCDCPKDHAVRHAQASPAATPRRTARRLSRGYAENGSYNYAAAAPVVWRRAQWRVAPNDAYIPGPMVYGPADVQIDDRGWTGGVGAAPDGGGGGGFVDGYGQVHFANGGSVENGPTYNGYNQSFQYNPSQAGPFQPRLMGGFAPSNSGSR